MMPFTLLLFAVVELSAVWPPQRSKSGLIEDTFEFFVAASGPLKRATFPRLFDHRRKAGSRRQFVRTGEALKRAGFHKELCRERGPPPRQRADEGRFRAASKPLLNLGIQLF